MKSLIPDSSKLRYAIGTARGRLRWMKAETYPLQRRGTKQASLLYCGAMRTFLVMAVLLGSSVRLLAQTNDPSSSASSPSPESLPAQQESARPAPAGATGGQAAKTAAGEPYTSPCPVTDKKGMSTGLLIEKVLPKYPQAARKARIQGTVVLCAEISKKGTIQSLRGISGPQVLIPPAMEAVRKWRYLPYRLKNKPVAVNTEIHVNFALP